VKRAAFVAGSILANVAAAAPLRAQEKRPLNVAYLAGALGAPVFVAADRGYFEAEGFDVTLSPIGAGLDAMALAATGRIDVVTAGLSAGYYNAIDRGLDVRYVASTAYTPKSGNSPTALLLRYDLWSGGGVKTLAQLRGLKFGWTGGLASTATYYVTRMLAPAGLGMRDISVVALTLPNQATALQNKSIDAIYSGSPQMEAFEQQKLAHIFAYPPAGISGSGIFFGSRLIHDRALASAVMRAIRRAAAAIAGAGYYSPETVATLAKYVQQPAADIARSPRYEIDARLTIDVKTLMDMQRMFAQLGLLSYTEPMDQSRLIMSI
jgi:NitT/TauT family transport system substrate-binding protein